MTEVEVVAPESQMKIGQAAAPDEVDRQNRSYSLAAGHREITASSTALTTPCHIYVTHISPMYHNIIL